MFKNLTDTLKQIAEVAKYLWDKGWAERNGGNLSLNLTGEIGKLKNLSNYNYIADLCLPKELSNHAFFVTGTGLRIRDLICGIKGLEKNACIIYLDDHAKGYYIIWGGKKDKDFRPTSELCTHLYMHLALIKQESSHKAVLHTHPIELIALSHSAKYCKSSKQLTNYLWSMLPEVRAFVPKGINIVPYALPGSQKLAELTVNALKNSDVALWKKHGAIATGKDLQEAFDFIDVANKGAIIFLKCLSAGFIPEGLSNQELKALEQTFNLPS